MMKIQSFVRARWFGSAVCMASALAACGGGGKDKDGGIVSGVGGSGVGGSGGEGGGTIPFDGEKAPYGETTTTTRIQSVVTVTSDLLGNKTRSQDTAVVGPKLVGGIVYDRLATVRSDDPTRGGEYWIKNNPDGTLDFAGFMHTDLLSGVLPGASTTFDAPIKVNLNPPIGVQQPVAATGKVTLDGTSAASAASFTGQYALAEKNATAATGVGPVAGCSHFTGTATTTSPEVPALLQGMTVAAELWYHPSYGVVAFNAPTLGVGTAMTGTYDCGSVDAAGYRIIRKVGVVDATTSFNLDSYECDGKAFAADKNTHAKMLLELRWADETAAKTSAEPMPSVEFGTGWGYYPNTIYPSTASVFHPEENGKGFQYWYSYVDQAAKNEPGTSTSYHIKVGTVAGLSPVRVTARIYYKTIPSLVGPGPDAAALGSGNKDGGGQDAALVDGSRDVAGVIGDGKDGTIADLPPTPVGDGGRDVPAGTGGTGGAGGSGGATGTGGSLVTVPPGTPTIIEEFDTLPTATTQFVPIQAAGGDFAKFATVSGGRLVVDVPANNNWGKTGVRSKDPIFEVTDDMAQSPWSVLVDLDPSASNGFVVALSPAAADDVWGYGNAWMAWIRHPVAGGTSASLVNTQNTADTSKTLTNTPLTAPGTVAVVARPGQVQGCTSSGWGLEGNYAWMKTGTKVYAYVFAHPYDANMPVKLAVKSIKVVRGAACGAAGAIPPYTAAPEKAVFADDLSGGTARYWTPIQAAGGDYAKFATTPAGDLFVNVPANNNWGKTGVRSSYYLFDVRDDMETTPLSLSFDLVPTQTSGFVVALSPAAGDDVWGYGNVWASFVRHPTGGGTWANLVNTQDANDSNVSLTNAPLTAPTTVTLAVRPGHVQVCTSTGWGMEGDYAWMKPGTKVYAYVFAHPYDANMPVQMDLTAVRAERVSACGASGAIPPYTAVPEKAVFADDLSAGAAPNWTPIQAAGGDYAKFATMSGGDLFVDVPANNNWGKTGVRSSYYLFDVRDDMLTTPLSLTFEFVPARTSGFVLALSPAAGDDVWGYGNVWGAFVRHPTGGGAFANLVNTQNTADSSKSLPNIPSTAPTTATLSVRPGHVQMCTSTGWGMEGDYAWLTKGTKVYAYAFAHAYDANMPVQMDLTSVRAERTAACGASGAVPAYPAPAPRVLFTDAFAGGYAQNWVGIGAAGGNFASFAVTTTNEVYVNVPANNNWGKTGIRSNYYLFDVRSDFATSPLNLDFAIDPARTSGFVIALSPAAGDDVWGYGNVWMAFIIDPDTGLAEFDLTNTQNTADTTISKTGLSAAMPSKVSLAITPKHVKATLSNGQVLEGDYAWLVEGTKVYAYAFSHPIAANLPSSLALKSVTATR